jgi:nitroimidazol reductase NimA-like FMN-containing flavoprotein (pyridoxamine 5'-phosphate oxidase superfamily)
LAYLESNRVNIQPIHFVYDGEWMYGRTSPGAKLAALTQRPWVAMEADEVHGPFDWRSVVAHGTFYIVEPNGTPEDEARFNRVLGQLRRLSPEIGGEGDPAPFRTALFGIHIDSLTGRSASTSGTA